MDGRFVSYLRVSTQRQGVSGLGLEAQREAVASYLNGGAWELLREFEEVETGKGADALDKRPQLREAIAYAKAHKATLVIAKLDRLARDVQFVSTLMNTGVEFACADMPSANRLTLHIMAAFAEHERAMISARTKAALATVKAKLARGEAHVSKASGKAVERLGGNGAATQRKNAEARVAPLRASLMALKAEGLTIRGMCARLNADGVASPGGGIWHVATMQRALRHLERSASKAVDMRQA